MSGDASGLEHRALLCASCLLTGGEKEDEQVRVDLMENQSMDFRNGFVGLCYNPDFVGGAPLERPPGAVPL